MKSRFWLNLRGKSRQKKQRRQHRRRLLLESLESRQLLAVDAFVVDTAVDENDGVGVGTGTSLREAIIAANADPDLTTITFDSALNGSTISIGGTVLQVTTEIDITGNGPANTQLSFAADGLVIPFDQPGELSVTDLSATGSGSGIGFHLDQGNYPAANSLSISRTTISGFSTGVRAQSKYGRYANLTLADSTISGNSTGVSVESSYGGIINAEVRNSTISGNTTGVATSLTYFFYYGYQQTTISNSTISGNTTGISASTDYSYSDSVTLQSTLVGDNGTDLTSSGNTTVNASNSLIESGAGAINGTNVSNITGVDPQLDPAGLQNNGGPTQTIALQAASPAIDAGSNPLGLVNDQRGAGFPREDGGTANIGAVEAVLPAGPTTFLVDTAVDESDGDFSVGDLSLREAIELANASVGAADTIEFDTAGVFSSPQTINLLLGQLNVTDDLTVNGPGADNLTINAGGTSRAVRSANANLDLYGVTITGGNAGSLDGGGVVLDGTGHSLTIRDSVISGNSARNGGGVFTSNDNNALIENSTISGNVATRGGGGVALNLNGSSGTVRNSTISNNQANSGGGIQLTPFGAGTSITVDSSTIASNQAVTGTFAALGGGIFIFNQGGSNVTVQNSTVSANTAAAVGGGISLTNFGATVDIHHSTITGNSAPLSAGGLDSINQPGGTVTVSHNVIAGNSGQRPDVFASFGMAASYNLIGIGSGSPFFPAPVGSPDANGNLVGTSSNPIDPLLDVLSDNGGPTESHLLLPGSPALNVGDPSFSSPPDFDQRGTGFDRVRGGRIDMGAIEVQNDAPVLGADNASVSANEGSTAANTGTISDPDFGGDTVTLTASVGTVTDTGGGAWSWSWDTTDGPDDSQLVTITATDSYGLQSTVDFTLTVDNVAPAVTVDNATVTVNDGDLAVNSGTFADPGNDTVTVTASVGTVVNTGGGTYSWSVDSTGLSSQTVTITATDSDGDSTDVTFSLVVEVSNPEDILNGLIDQIISLRDDDGTINGGQANSLISKIENALKSLDKDKLGTAVNQLNALKNQINAFESSGVLTQAEADPLLEDLCLAIDLIEEL